MNLAHMRNMCLPGEDKVSGGERCCVLYEREMLDGGVNNHG